MKSRDAFKISADTLLSAGVSEPVAKAKVLVSHVLNTGYAQVFSDTDVSDEDYKTIREMTEKCAAGEPVEYVTGKAYFRYLTLNVDPSVLIPRKETELVAGKAIDLIKDNNYHTALDMCTGSGCIAISIAKETGIKVSALDISERALNTAEKNAQANGASVSFFLSDMFEKAQGAYDIIVSNPPYVSEKEYGELDKSVRSYEPGIALLAGDGLDFYRTIADKGVNYLNSGGALVVEIGAEQAGGVMLLLKKSGFKKIQCDKDYEGRDRIVFAFKEQ